MSPTVFTRPEISEYAPYYGRYVQLVPEGDVIHGLEHQLNQTLLFLRALPAAAGDKRYAPDKWSVKEVLGHLVDAERVFTQRALFFARKCASALPSYEQDEWTAAAAFGDVQLADLITEYELVRQSDLCFFRHLSDEAWTRRGIASGCEFTVRSLAFIILGHERHHVEILRTRYT